VAVNTLLSRTLYDDDAISFFISPLSVDVSVNEPVKIVDASEVSTVSRYTDGWTVGGFWN
jgi:hypothetical protein